MNILNKLHISFIGLALGPVALIAGLTSCNAIFEDAEPCASGVELRFIYDYHMERGNAFMYNVDCLTVHLYDEDGRHLSTFIETSKALSDEDWRMILDLPTGSYRAVAYGGMECDESSFEHTSGLPTAGTHQDNLGVNLKEGLHDGTLLNNPLHDHFWGTVDFSVKGDSFDRDKATVEMRKNTNNIRIVLQHLSGEPVDPDQFDFSVIADNTHMAVDNSLISKGYTTYKPWIKGQTNAGILPDGTTLSNAYAQISTSRLVETPGANPRIRVTRATRADGVDDTDNTVLDLDLIGLVKLARQQNEVINMPLQEYLDRESRWSFIFLLDKNDNYYSLHIKVNDWDVRINNFEPF